MDQGIEAIMEKGIRGVFPGIRKVIVSTDDECSLGDAALTGLIKRMKELKADDVLLQCDDGMLLVVKYDYGDMFAAVYYENGVSPADLSRLIQLMFARQRNTRSTDRAFMPAADVERLINRWEKRIGLVFGVEFSQDIIEKELAGKDKNAMMPADMESMRSSISSALGDCLQLDKVNK